MPDWLSAQELARDTAALAKIQHVLCGVYFWEFLISLDFEWGFITGRKKLKWSMLFYFAGRYLALSTLIGVLIASDADSTINCEALYTFLAFGGQAVIGLSSANLAIRAMAIWSLNQRVVISLLLLILGQWTLLVRGIFVHTNWSGISGCTAVPVRTDLVEANFIYAIVFDSIIFVLSAWRLTLPKHRRSQLVDLMFKDGLFYFIIVLLVNIPAAVMLSLNLNPIMNMLPALPAAIISSMLAGRAVRRLYNFHSSVSPNVGWVSGVNDVMVFGSNSTVRTQAQASRMGGVRIQMDTIVCDDDDLQSNFTKITDPNGYNSSPRNSQFVAAI